MEALADYVTRVQARRSLREAAAEAQGAVDTVAEVLAEIYRGEVSGEDDESLGGVQLLVTSLAADHDQLLLYRAGVSIVGYYREANGRRDKYYRRALLTLQLNDDGISGFCHDPETGAVDSECINETELSALRQVEDLLDRLQPEFEAYQAQRAEMTAWRALRRANGNRIVRAAGAWATEHERVVEALNDGSGASAFTLQAILAEIQSIQ